MLRKIFLVIAVLTTAITRTAAGPAGLKDLRPGFNLFSSQQDIEVGREGGRGRTTATDRRYER
jgi:hypothetical protein